MLREDFIALMTPEAQSLLRSDALRADLSKANLVKLVSDLRAAGHSAGLVAAVLTQAKLRHRATAKFGEFAERMLFTEAGLEQSSRLAVAALHAGRFRNAGCRSIADLGCGIGTESLAFASIVVEGEPVRVSAFELDEVTAAVATHNLAPFDNVSVEQADVTDLAAINRNLDEFDGLFFDPARRELKTAARSGGRGEAAVRKFDPASFSPNFDWVLSVCRGRTAGIKLGPGHPHEGIPEAIGDEAIEAQWVSVAGDLVELALWFGRAARPSVNRSALLIDRAGKHHELTSATRESEPAELAELGEFLYEPDNAIIRSHLIGDLAEQLGLTGIAPSIAYLSSNSAVESPWLRGFRIIDNLAFDRKKLKAYLAARDIGTLEIKKRGSDVVPEELRKQLALKGKSAATLIVTRVGDAHRCLIAEAI